MIDRADRADRAEISSRPWSSEEITSILAQAQTLVAPSRLEIVTETRMLAIRLRWALYNRTRLRGRNFRVLISDRVVTVLPLGNPLVSIKELSS